MLHASPNTVAAILAAPFEIMARALCDDQPPVRGLRAQPGAALSEHFRGVVWPRSPTQNSTGTVYRYVIVGMLVTDEPLDVDPNETTIDGAVAGIGAQLAEAHRVHLAGPLGDANAVLLRLAEWPPMERGEVKP